MTLAFILLQIPLVRLLWWIGGDKSPASLFDIHSDTKPPLSLSLPHTHSISNTHTHTWTHFSRISSISLSHVECQVTTVPFVFMSVRHRRYEFTKCRWESAYECVWVRVSACECVRVRVSTCERWVNNCRKRIPFSKGELDHGSLRHDFFFIVDVYGSTQHLDLTQSGYKTCIYMSKL